MNQIDDTHYVKFWLLHPVPNHVLHCVGLRNALPYGEVRGTRGCLVYVLGSC